MSAVELLVLWRVVLRAGVPSSIMKTKVALLAVLFMALSTGRVLAGECKQFVKNGEDCGCDSSRAYCNHGNNGTVKFICSGNGIACGGPGGLTPESESWGNSQSTDGVACGKTIQIDAFD